jgi:putative polyhydroxyalkanoate system protein
MADIDIRRVHDMSMAQARAAAEKMAAHLGAKFGLQGDWEGDTLHFDRPGVQGSLHLAPGHLALHAEADAWPDRTSGGRGTRQAVRRASQGTSCQRACCQGGR